jgi:undecaprenyl phosphate-alpha-L-ara4N flippase subunit ArnE
MGASGLTLSAMLLLIFCIAAETCQQLAFKAGSDRVGEAAGFSGILRQPLVWIGVGIWVIEMLAWVMVLRQAPLSIAYPMMTLSYVGVPAMGVLLLGERMSRRQVGGALLIAFGVLCVALSGGGA